MTTKEKLKLMEEIKKRNEEHIKERKEAEKMMGCKIKEMTQEQAVLAAEILSAFNGLW